MSKKRSKEKPEPKPPSGQCFACGKNVTGDDFCWGCRAHICESCNVGALSVPLGGHRRDAHLQLTEDWT